MVTEVREDPVHDGGEERYDAVLLFAAVHHVEQGCDELGQDDQGMYAVLTVTDVGRPQLSLMLT